MNNYYYYLKHEIAFSPGSELTCMVWDPEVPLSIHIALRDGHYVNHEFCWDVFSSTSVSKNNFGTVAVVDGGLWLCPRCPNVAELTLTKNTLE